MNIHLREALGYLTVGIAFFIVIVNPIFAIVVFLFRICLFILGFILIWASIGKILDYFNRNKEESNNCLKD